jgi:hypothetical protein
MAIIINSESFFCDGVVLKVLNLMCVAWAVSRISKPYPTEASRQRSQETQNVGAAATTLTISATLWKNIIIVSGQGSSKWCCDTLLVAHEVIAEYRGYDNTIVNSTCIKKCMGIFEGLSSNGTQTHKQKLYRLNSTFSQQLLWRVPGYDTV